MDEILEKILAIEENNIFLKYIVERVQRDDYRGMQISQHNRYTLKEVKVMFEEIYKIAGDEMFSVPLGDYTDASRVQDAKAEHAKFTQIIKNINDRLGRTTINSLKKNFFPDFARSGFIDRFGRKKELLDPYKRSAVYYAKLNKPAIELALATNILRSYYIFSHQIDILFGDHISELANVIYYSDYRDTPIQFVEFQYILSDILLDEASKITLLSAYRSLNFFQKKKVEKFLKEYCDPDRVDGNRTVQRDYHNWRNETQQIMYLLKNTIYFDVRRDSFALNRGAYGIFPETVRQSRSLSVKQEYFDSHKIEKIEDFELHHIIPISYAKNREEFKLIDNFQNLIYLHKDKHGEIKKDYIIFREQNPKIFFESIMNASSRVVAKNDKDSKFNEALLPTIKKYNQELRKSLFGA